MVKRAEMFSVTLIAAGAAVIGVANSCTADPPGITIPAPRSTLTPKPTIPVEPDKPTVPAKTQVGCSVTRVVDGDTVKARCGGGTVTLRLIGIDTPETVDPRKPVQCYGPEASRRAHQLLDGTRIKIRPDASQGTRDKYGRLLVYVTMADGRDFGLEMIEGGFAREYTYDTAYQMSSRYKRAEHQAEAAKRGLWGACNR